MPALSITLDGVHLKDIALTQPRTTLGRRPYNDIVVDHLAVSGEHAIFVLHPDGVEVQDLHSTNGTYVNGRAIVSQRVGPDDTIEIGRYLIRLKALPEDEPSASTPVASPAAPVATAPSAPLPLGAARIRVLSGPAAGKSMGLTKVVTTLGKPGVAVAAITHRGEGYTLALVDGLEAPRLNGQPIGAAPVPLHPRDEIELAGTRMRFEAD